MKPHPKFSLLTLVAALAVGGVAPYSHAAPAMQNIPVGPSYLAYVGSDNTDTLSAAKPNSTREKLGAPMTMLFHAERLNREINNGYATMFATWAQTTLRVPLGWYAVESKNNVDESLIYSPGQSIQIVARAAIENQKFQSDHNAFSELKAASVGQTRARLQKMGLTVGPIERIDLDDETFAVRAPKATDKAGHTFSYLERFSQRAPKAKRDEYWAKRARKEPLSPLQLPLALSLLAPADKFEKYAGLFGLMARDEGLNWATEESLSLDEFNQQVPDAARFIKVADEAVGLLKTGDYAGFNTRFPEAFEGVAKPELERHMREVVTPFLNKLPDQVMRTNVNVVRDHDPIMPLFRVTLSRDFELAKDNNPTYVIVMDRVGFDIQLLATGTTDDPGAV